MDLLPASLKCPSCASPIRDADYEQEQGTIRCSYCGTLMMLPRHPRSGEFLARPPVTLPAGMKLESTVRGLLIYRRWFNWSILFLIPFCIAWNSFLIGFYTSTSGGNVPWFVRLFPLAHVVVGVGLSYYTLALLFNRTQVEVTHGSVTVSHGPLPWTGWREIAAGFIDQLYCKEIIRRNKNGVSTHYEVWVVLSDGTHSRLLAAGMEPDQALYIEQQIEGALDIKDRAMAGEYRR